MNLCTAQQLSQVRLYKVMLVFILFLCSSIINIGDGCTEGFMDIDLLRAKAEQIPNTQGIYSNNILDSNSRYLFPSLRFICSTTITGIIIGVDVRTITDTRNGYPQLEIWSGQINQFRQVSGSNRIIELVPDNFTTYGVYTYQFSQPLSVEMDNILGIYQPPHEESVVRVHYENSSNTAYKLNNLNDDMVNVRNAATSQNLDLIIYPLTDNPNCLGTGFQTSEMIQSKVLQVTDVLGPTNTVRGFSDIMFTCDGIITKWIVGINDVTGNTLPNIQLLRSDMTVITSLTVDTNNGISTGTNVYEFTSILNTEVKTGDILVVDSTDVPVYYQQYNGPQNYMIDSSNTLVEVEENNYPLVSVVVVPTSSTSSLVEITSPSTSPVAITSLSSPVDMKSSSVNMTSSSSSVSTTSSLSVDTSSSGSKSSIMLTEISTWFNPASTASSFQSTATSSSPNAVPARGDPGESLTGIISGVVVTVIVILLLIPVLIVGVLILITLRKKKKGSVELSLDNNGTVLSNPVDQGNALPDKGNPGLDMLLTNPVYGAQVIVNVSKTVGLNETVVHTPAGIYEEPEIATNAQSDFYSEAGMNSNNAMYGMNNEQSINSEYEGVTQSNPYNTLEWGICVPTTAQRQEIEGHYEMQENMYGYLQNMQYSSLKKSDDYIFFTEEKLYWTPGEDTSVLYEQLAQKKYREILRQEIEVTGHLGSGQFGTVDKGVWKFPSGTRDVAIKTLKDSAAEEEKVKFLQEAAINGQFHHPNVVKLYGVVTVGEPAMIVLELVLNGDLKGYLQKMRPVPGELVDTTVPSILLSFCRQIASGMEYLSKKCFVHRDLAARNILVADNGICKIADFGMSRDLQNESYYISHTKKIPIKWTAPEALNFKKYSTASDVWSFGVVLYEIWSLGHKPFEENSNQESMQLVDSGYRLPPPPGCPQALYDMMIQCWHPETSSRPTFVDLVCDLSQPDFKLLQTETDTCLGANLDTAHNLYPELQKIYME